MQQLLNGNPPAVNPVVPVDIVAPPRAPKIIQACALRELTKPQLGIHAADVLDGLARLQFDSKLASKTFGISIATINRACRLTPEQRELVWGGKRKLVTQRPGPPL